MSTGHFKATLVSKLLLAVYLTLFTSVCCAYVSKSGDVDDDGQLTVRDAVLILQARSWPEFAGLRAFQGACDINKDGHCSRTDADAVFGVTVSDWNDWDGDGIGNDSDCAILDERVATPQSFYRDLDGDHFGNGSNPIKVCAASPPWNLVAWGNDPDDIDQFNVPRIVSKGTRTLAIDVSDRPEDGHWPGKEISDLGADALTLVLPWNAVETAAGDYAVLDAILSYYRAKVATGKLKLSITITPMVGERFSLPEDLQVRLESGVLRLNDDEVVQRFKSLLKRLHEQTNGIDITSLMIGHEIDRALANSPAYFWSDFGEFLYHVFGEAKGRWGTTLKIGTTATYVALINEPSSSTLKFINSLADVVSVTYVPHDEQFRALDQEHIKSDIEAIVAAGWPKPIHIQNIGISSSPSVGSSEVKQSQFLNSFFESWDTWADHIPFVGFGQLFDLSQGVAASKAFGLPTNAATYVRTSGVRLYRGLGPEKAGFKTLRNLAFNRGWWSFAEPETRTFLMGYTPAQYDFPHDAGSYLAMMDWIWGAIASDTDIVNLHLDHGVPWVEALADNFQSNQPPYSDAVMAMWSSLRDHIPNGHKRLVSINPLGVPRNVIAPYFGVGQGFVYDFENKRLPNGEIQDAENRYPPPPWDSYSLNHDSVKKGFLNYCKRAIDYFQPDYLMVAIEVTATMVQSPTAFGQFIELQSYVYRNLKEDPRYARVPIVVSVSATSYTADEFGIPYKLEDQVPRMRELHLQGLLDLVPYIDVLGLSFYPHYGIYNSTIIPPYLFDSLFSALKKAGKRIGIAESGFPAESFDILGNPFFSNENNQDRFYKLLLHELEGSPVPVEFVISFQPRDADLGWNRLLEDSKLDPPKVAPHFVEFYKYFRDIGLYDGNGDPRPALRTWRAHFEKTLSPRK